MFLRESLASSHSPELQAKSTRLSELMVRYDRLLANTSHMKPHEVDLAREQLDELWEQIQALRIEVNLLTERILKK